MQSSTFGVDLGTTNSVAAIWKNGTVDVIAYKTGSRLFPSYVAYNKKNPANSVIGQFAKQKMESPSYGVFHSCKRLLGVPYNSNIVKIMKDSVGYDIREDAKGKLVVAIKTDKGDIVKHPEDVGAMILSAIAEEMKAYAGFDIRNVVITVPAYFDQYKRDLTKLAGQIAGLNVRAIISEPQAAAYAYLDYTDNREKSTFMIYDLGGGTFDVTILRCEGNQFTELATDGDVFCGGFDFDKLILDKIKGLYEEETKRPFPIKLTAEVLAKCEQAKIALLGSFQTEIEVTYDQIYALTLAEMNRLIGPKLEDTLKICDRAIQSAGIEVSEIDHIILVGGSTRLKLVGELLEKHFPNIPIKGNISPDECVAYGAAKYAHNLDLNIPVPESVPEPASMPEFEYIINSRYSLLPPSEEPINTPQPPKEKPIQVVDIQNVEYFARCPSDIGISNAGRMEVLIPRNTPLPISKRKLIHLRIAAYSIIRISLYQGNDPLVKNNGMLKNMEIHLEPNNEIYLSIRLDMAKDGSLSVRVVDYLTGDSYEYKDIQAALTKEELKERQNTIEQERNTRNRLLALDNIRNRLQYWGLSLLNENVDEEDRRIIDQNVNRLLNEGLTEELTDEVYNVLCKIHEKLVQ